MSPFLGFSISLALLGARAFAADVPYARFELSEVSAARLAELSRSDRWLALLHYRKTLTSNRSEIDGSEFFHAPDGAKNPESELIASANALAADNPARFGPLKQHAQCAFPARFEFLKRELRQPVQSVPCPEYTAWKQGLPKQGVSLVYAAPYLGSPASIFGHTFLKLTGSGDALLDYSLSFDAVTSSRSGLSYVALGLMGGFPGAFSLSRYYLKAGVYVAMENRDLWEIPLNLTPSEIDAMLSHVWELGLTHIDYYFFDENCSYHLLSLLEVARPTERLRTQFYTHAIPIGTLRAALISFGTSTRIYRPSLHARLTTRLSLLSDEERELFFKEREAPQTLTASASVLDAWIDDQTMRAMSADLSSEDAARKVPPALLLARAKAGKGTSVPSKVVDPQDRISPENGHASMRVALGVGREAGRWFGSLSARAAVHDFLDPPEAQLAFSSLEIASLQLEYEPATPSRFRLEKFAIASVVQLNPGSAVQPAPAFRITAGLERPRELCAACIGFGVDGGYGKSFALGSDAVLYGLLTGRAELNPRLVSTVRAGPGAELGAIAQYRVLKWSGAIHPSARFDYLLPRVPTRYGLWTLGTNASLNFGVTSQLRLELSRVLWIERAENRGLLTTSFYF